MVYVRALVLIALACLAVAGEAARSRRQGPRDMTDSTSVVTVDSGRPNDATVIELQRTLYGAGVLSSRSAGR